MAENKTTENAGSVRAFLETVENDERRTDSYTLLPFFEKITGKKPKMWGGSIIGYGSYHYKYDSGREGDFFRAGFSPRKTSLTLYMMAGFTRYDEILSRLGKYKTGKSCLYVKRLSDIDMEVLQELTEASLNYMQEKYPEE